MCAQRENSLVHKLQPCDLWCPGKGLCLLFLVPATIWCFFSLIGRMVFINGFHHRWLSSGLLCPHGLCLCLDVWFAVFVLIFIDIDICCALHHGHIKVLEVKYNFCYCCHKVLRDLVSTAENTVCKNSHLSLEMFGSILKKMTYLLTSQVQPSFPLHFCPCRMQL